MKKKMVMVAMILGALSLGSCVENNESASVEAVRGAKAEQLKSVATLNNANAEAALILAKAEAAVQNATAEGLKIANELKGIDLEIAKVKLSIRLEAAKIEAEAELENAKVRLITAKAALIAAMDNVTIAEKKRVQTLLSKADEVLGRMNGNRNDLIDAKFAKAGLEAGLEGFKAAKEKDIIVQKRKISTSEALIAEYSKYDQSSKVDAETAANEAEGKAKELSKVQLSFNQAKVSATAKVDAAKKLVDESVYLTNATYTIGEIVASHKVEYTHSDGTYGAQTTQSYTKATADTDKMTTEVNRAERDLVIANSVLADVKKVLTDLKASQNYKDLQKDVTDARTAWNEATTTADKNQKRAALDAAEIRLKNASVQEEQDVKTATENVTAATKELKNATDKLAAVNANEVAYVGLVKAWEDAMAAELDARIASDKADHNYTVQNTLATSLRGIATGLEDIATLILTEKEVIATANEAIARLQVVSTNEELISAKAREIAKLEQNIKIDEAAYADYMAQIKALIESAK